MISYTNKIQFYSFRLWYTGSRRRCRTTDYKEVTPEQRTAIVKLLDKFEDDEDVQNVFHNMKEDE